MQPPLLFPACAAKFRNMPVRLRPVYTGRSGVKCFADAGIQPGIIPSSPDGHRSVICVFPDLSESAREKKRMATETLPPRRAFLPFSPDR